MKNKHASHSRLHVLWAAVMLSLATFCAAEDDRTDNRLRRYDRGPLTSADFRDERPEDQRHDAYTSTDIRYQFRCDFQVRDSIVTATMSSIDVYAALERHKSWNTRKSDKALLDHEQGHFDLAQTLALTAQTKFLTLLRAGDAPTAKGSSKDEAIQKLDNAIRGVMNSATQLRSTVHLEYDRVTRYGNNATEQARQRKLQLAALQSAIDRIEELNDD